MFFGGLIPGSDSGKAEEAWVCVFASALTVVLFRFLNLNKNHLQESRAFWILFCGKKVSEEIKIETQPLFELISLSELTLQSPIS